MLKNRHLKYLIPISILFFIIYSFLAFQHPQKFSSPDENANFVFIKQFIENSSFEIDEPLNAQFEGLIHPRNATVNNSKIVPFSFIGFSLFLGILGKILGISGIYFITPFFAALAGIFFFFLIKEVFSLKIALLSTLIYYIYPAIWYNSSISFQHNSLFLSFLIISLFLLLYLIKTNKLLFYLLLGFFLGLVCIIRTNEAAWIIPLVLVILFLNRKKIKSGKVLLGVLVFIIAISPMLILNNNFYGSPFKFGYFNNVNNSTTSNDSNNNNAISFLIKKPKKVFFPSGIDINKAVDTFFKYQAKIFYPYFFLLIVGLFLLLKKFKLYGKNIRFYLLFFILISTYLTLYYGSGEYFGSTSSNLKEIFISSSIVRYWMPIYTFSIPIIVVAILKILKLFSKKFINLFIFLLISFIFLFSADAVYYYPDSGLTKISENEQLYQDINNDIIDLTQEDSIIITNQTDKIIYPERKVIALHNALENDNYLDNKFSLIYDLLKEYKIYYFTMYGADLEQLNNKLRNSKISIKPLKKIQDISSLYELNKID